MPSEVSHHDPLPVTAGTVREEVHKVATSGETKLFVREFSRHPIALHGTNTNLRRPTLLISHGLGEHGGCYRDVAKFAAQQGWRVILGDHRGHGLSSGPRTHVRSFAEYTSDLNEVWHHFELKPSRTVVIGHSMGGLIAARFLQTYLNRAAGLILSSPLLKVKVRVPRSLIVVGKLLSRIAPRTRFASRVKEAREQRSGPQRECCRDVDPLLVRTVTASWYFQMRRTLVRAGSEAALLTIPILLSQAGEDDLVDLTAAKPWLDRTSSSRSKYRLHPKRGHDLLTDPGWQTVLGEMLDWAREVIPQGASRTSHAELRNEIQPADRTKMSFRDAG